ncbi:TetR/AcrR family transcriptional regulator [Actinomycetospora sp. CA-084318]|uniref:TetR/AcrR family transcriptional regulator n=1 Tax=Actinomycetospora sp. CA-084318 TaxID=3239892 RepID=UPI003D9950C3
MARRTKTRTETAEESVPKSARTRARLLDATAKVLAERGYAGTRLSDIAEEAHVQAPAIYYYYAHREELVGAVLTAGAEAMVGYLTERLAALPADSSPSVRLATAVEAHLRHELELSDYARAFIRNTNQVPPDISRPALDVLTAYFDVWRGLVADLAQAGLLRDDVDPSLGRMLVMGALNWCAEWWDPDRGPIDDLIVVAQSMVLHALRP